MMMMMMMMMKCFVTCHLLILLLLMIMMTMMMMMTTATVSSNVSNASSTPTTTSSLSSYIITLPRIETSIYEQYNPMKDNMSNWMVVSRASTPSFVRSNVWREFHDIRYNLSIQHGSYEGYSPGNWNYFSLYYDYSYVPYGVWFIVYPKTSNGVMVNVGYNIGIYDHNPSKDNKEYCLEVLELGYDSYISDKGFLAICAGLSASRILDTACPPMALLQRSYGRIEKCYCDDDDQHDLLNCEGDGGSGAGGIGSSSSGSSGIGNDDGGDGGNGGDVNIGNKIITSFHYHYHASIVIMTNTEPSIHNYHLLQQRLLSFDTNQNSSSSSSSSSSRSSSSSNGDGNSSSSSDGSSGSSGDRSSSSDSNGDSSSSSSSSSSNHTSRLVLHMIRNYSYINITHDQSSPSSSSSSSDSGPSTSSDSGPSSTSDSGPSLPSSSSTLYHHHHLDIPQLKEELSSFSSSSAKPHFRFVGYDSSISIYSSLRIQEININDRYPYNIYINSNDFQSPALVRVDKKTTIGIIIEYTYDDIHHDENLNEVILKDKIHHVFDQSYLLSRVGADMVVLVCIGKEVWNRQLHKHLKSKVTIVVSIDDTDIPTTTTDTTTSTSHQQTVSHNSSNSSSSGSVDSVDNEGSNETYIKHPFNSPLLTLLDIKNNHQQFSIHVDVI